MDVNTVNSAATGTYGALKQNNLGQEAFLQLLVTQLRYQDPMNPMENTEFLAQLSQFSSLEQLWNMNETMSRNVDMTQSVNNALMPNLIGKEVKVMGNIVQWENDSATSLSYNLDAVGDVTVEIMDSQGKVIRTVDVGQQLAGEHMYQWDGKDNQGDVAPEGGYLIRVKAVDAQGAETQPITYLTGPVTSIEFVDGNPVIYLGDQIVNPSDIVSISGSSN